MSEAWAGSMPMAFADAIGFEAALREAGKIVSDISDRDLMETLPKGLRDWFKKPKNAPPGTDEDDIDEKAKGVIRLDDLFGILDQQLSETEQLKDILTVAAEAMAPIPPAPKDNPRIRIKLEAIRWKLQQGNARFRLSKRIYARAGKLH
jgi:hypothetical protein